MGSPILPINIRFEDWAAQIGPTLKRVIVPLPVPVKQWRGWATGVLLINASLVGNVPTPHHHIYPLDEDWKRWAARFIQVVFNT